MIFRVVAAFLGTVLFMVLFNTSRHELFLCGLMGALSWGIFDVLTSIFGVSSSMSAFIATMLICAVALPMARWRKNPVTIYELAGIIPLVPGLGMYQTLYHLVVRDYAVAMDVLMETMGVAGAIAVAMLLMASVRKLSYDKRLKAQI